MVRGEDGFKQQSEQNSSILLCSSIKKSTVEYFGSFQTNLHFKDEALNHSEDPQKACQT